MCFSCRCRPLHGWHCSYDWLPAFSLDEVVLVLHNSMCLHGEAKAKSSYRHGQMEGLINGWLDGWGGTFVAVKEPKQWLSFSSAPCCRVSSSSTWWTTNLWLTTMSTCTRGGGRSSVGVWLCPPCCASLSACSTNSSGPREPSER